MRACYNQRNNHVHACSQLTHAAIPVAIAYSRHPTVATHLSPSHVSPDVQTYTLSRTTAHAHASMSRHPPARFLPPLLDSRKSVMLTTHANMRASLGVTGEPRYATAHPRSASLSDTLAVCARPRAQSHRRFSTVGNQSCRPTAPTKPRCDWKPKVMPTGCPVAPSLPDTLAAPEPLLGSRESIASTTPATMCASIGVTGVAR
jgi:hypothetical protein